ncbi:MAG: hypothetical protein JW724_00055 [Candidatus Altiarchaeota archaeon]|nr:hypothetical protein [Candidatus Altiarchaeota archaeon]
MVTQFDAFWKAFAITAVIFVVGVLVGVWLDSSRVEAVREEYVNMEIRSSDARMQSLYYRTQTLSNLSDFCGPAIEENLAFADKVYADGLRLEQYEKVNKLAPSLIKDKTRYTLLKLQFWLNCIELRKTCNASYTNLVYFYSHYNTTTQEQVQGAVLMDLKSECGPDLMLIPLPTDLNITTIEIIKKQYDITTTPALLIDERIKLEGLQSREALSQTIKAELTRDLPP